MNKLTNIDDSTLYSTDPSDVELGWEILSRPQTMRVVPAIPNAATLKQRIENAIASGGGAFVVIGDLNAYPGGILLYETTQVDGEDLQSLAFSFDRCVAGREWAQKCINWLTQRFPLEDRSVLIGPSMSNSERLAKSVGLQYIREVEINGEACRLFQTSEPSGSHVSTKAKLDSMTAPRR